MDKHHVLSVWANADHVADITHDARNDSWDLAYTPQWRSRPDSFPLCPSLPLPPPGRHGTIPYPPGTIKRFLENLLPEGHALDAVADSQRISKNNIFGLVRTIGSEATGAFRFLSPEATSADARSETAARRVTLAELHERIASRGHRPLLEWDGKIRMSVAGLQDKLPVYVHGNPGDTQDVILFLPDFPLASTHILKPQPLQIEHMVVNEHYCMRLAKAMGLPAAEVGILRTPDPVLAVTRFDRRFAPAQVPGVVSKHLPSGERLRPVERLHIVDACQAYDLPVSYKYERNFGSGRDVAHIRDGMSLPRLFKLARTAAISPAPTKRALLQWALFQLLIGNVDAHGKNFSFFVMPAGLYPAPWYDLVSVAQYPAFANEFAMAFGDAFTLDELSGMELAQFAVACDIDQRYLAREAARLCKLAGKVAPAVLDNMAYLPEERRFVAQIVKFVTRQADWLTRVAELASDFPSDALSSFDRDLV
ncbi:MAG TPA: HipA domain-containing protein [Burkholderiaceae bacterium]|nr:HipA domain-containing protein [Burkholderiaceae bacterium]